MRDVCDCRTMLTAGTDPLGQTTYYGHDAYGQRSWQLDPLGAARYWEYDASGYVTAQTDPGGPTTYFERDALGLETAKTLPNDVTTYHDYDAAGQVQSIVHAGPGGVLESLEYTSDDAGRRTRIVREDGTRIYFGYDDANRLTSEDWLDPSDVHIYGFACGGVCRRPGRLGDQDKVQSLASSLLHHAMPWRHRSDVLQLRCSLVALTSGSFSLGYIRI